MIDCVTFSASFAPYSPWQEYCWWSSFQSTVPRPQPSKTGVSRACASFSISLVSSQKISHSSFDSASGGTAASQ
jgi:hypothetical protein